MTKLKFKDEDNNFISVVQDVKVNGESITNGTTANLEMIMIPKPPLLIKNKIYTLKLINGDLTWVEEERESVEDVYISNTIMVFDIFSESTIEENLLMVSDISSSGVQGRTLVLN